MSPPVRTPPDLLLHTLPPPLPPLPPPSLQTPPRGLQLHLGSPAQPHMVDTLVMSNLAYFQLKAAPGRWVRGDREERGEEGRGSKAVPNRARR